MRMPSTKRIQEALEEGMHPEDILFLVLLARHQEGIAPARGPKPKRETQRAPKQSLDPVSRARELDIEAARAGGHAIEAA